MKLTNTVLVLALACGTGRAQNGQVANQGAKATANAAQQKQSSNVKAVSVAAPAAKPAAKKPAAVQASTPAAKPAVVSVSKPAAAKPLAPAKAAASQPASKSTPPSVSAKSSSTSAPKAVAATPMAKPVAVKPPVAKPIAVKAVTVKSVPATKQAPAKAGESKPAAKDAAPNNVSVEKAAEPVKADKNKTYSANGRRDPFVSPVVAQSAVGSGCSTGKRCLAVDQISLKGVVKSETGMIAVVVNALDKAYFLRENDPVFDGYVLKITTDSIVFKETVQDKLGKPFTKEVTKKLNTPAV